MARVNAAKVRKDLSLLGSFGTRGTGYDTAFLIAQIDRALGVDRDWPVAIVGIGNLGRALVNSEGFSSRGFRVAALFDVDPAVVGTAGRPGGGPPRRRPARLAGAGRAGHRRGRHPGRGRPGGGRRPGGDRGPSILNFAPRVLTVPPDVLLRYVDLSIELQVMSFYQSRSGDADGERTPACARWGSSADSPR